MIEAFDFPLEGRPIGWLWWDLPVAMQCQQCECERRITRHAGHTIIIGKSFCVHMLRAGSRFDAVYKRIFLPWSWVKGLFR